MEKALFTYFDFQSRSYSHDIAMLFPEWSPGDERVAILSPHDDDALLGAGYLIQAVQENGGEIFVIILCDGWAGYSTPAERDSIVERREVETSRAYEALGIGDDRILRGDYPDFSLIGYLGWRLPDGSAGAMQFLLPKLREIEATRLILPNGYREHPDHEAAAWMGRYDAPQVGDPVLADIGNPSSIRGALQYSVWGDFSPEDALVHSRSSRLRANRGLLAPRNAEEKVIRGIQAYDSQKRILSGLLQARKARRHGERWLEVYLNFDPRPGMNYEPYHRAIREIEKRHVL
jgi:hypothetical protein